LKAAFLKGPRKMIVKDTDDPKSKPDQVVVKVKYCGICGSDLHAYETGLYSGIMGHEFSGDIESLGDGVKGWQIGDRVTANPNLSCGVCYYCRRGETQLCPKLTPYGVFAPGAFAERIAVRADLLRKLSDNVSYEDAALIETLVTPLRATKLSVKLGDSVLVMGAGPIGLFAIQCAKIMGATVYASEVSEVRANAAVKLGADVVINPSKTRIGLKINELTKGFGLDVVIDCAGTPDTVRDSILNLRKGGKMMMIALPMIDIPVRLAAVAAREVEIRGIYDGSLEDFDLAAQLIERKKVGTGPIVTGKIGLSDIVEKGFEELLKPEKNHIKILVDPQR
jgi:(R,R)-butanediol dehydrogenase/meso-butanediol dehydrogenase/diacetyl reductase